MESTLDAFRKRLARPWLTEVSPEGALAQFDDAVDVLKKAAGPVVVGFDDPVKFLLYALGAITLKRTVFLATAQWPKSFYPRKELPAVTLLGEAVWPEGSDVELPVGSIGIATGGSSGRLRFALHNWDTLSATVAGYKKFWALRRIHCVNVLPLHHVGGFIPALRTFMTDGRLVLADWKAVESGELPKLPSRQTQISLVPTQVKRLIADEKCTEWLKSFRTVLIGGGASSSTLLDKVIEAGVPVALAYGMTEAAGTIAIQKDFKRSPNTTMKGSAPLGELLPHWKAKIVEREIHLSGPALFKGYIPGDMRKDAWHPTGDVGRLFDERELVVFGRADRMINSGGEKVNPFFVQEALLNCGLCRDAVVVGKPDPEWGQIVVAILQGQPVAEEMLTARLRSSLPAYAMPKRYFWVDELPRNRMGKVDFEKLDSFVLPAG